MSSNFRDGRSDARPGTARLRLAVGVLVGGMVAGGCAPAERESLEVPELSSEPQMQRAFERCVRQAAAEIDAENADAPADIVEVLYVGAADACGAAVLRACEKGMDTAACVVILDVYESP